MTASLFKKVASLQAPRPIAKHLQTTRSFIRSVSSSSIYFKLNIIVQVLYETVTTWDYILL